MRRECAISKIVVNSILIEKVIIDDHVDKHIDHIDDNLVLMVVRLLDGKDFDPVSIDEVYEYYATKIKFDEKWYKLIWLLEDGCFYLGVITLFRDRRLE